MVFERLGWDKLVKIQHAITLPIVMVGVVLSTLHQSSLGGLFLIVPGKLYPLWYSQMLPLLFFISAMCMGLAMVIVLSRISARAFGRTLELPILSDLSRVLLAGLWVYGVTRIFDLVQSGFLRAGPAAHVRGPDVLAGVRRRRHPADCDPLLDEATSQRPAALHRGNRSSCSASS